MDTYTHLAYTGLPEAVSEVNKELNESALKGLIHIPYATIDKSEIDWVYDGILLLMDNQQLQLSSQDIVINKLMEVNHAGYDFNIRLLEAEPDQCQKIINKYKKLAENYDESDSVIFNEEGCDYLRGYKDGSIPEVLEFRERFSYHANQSILKDRLRTSFIQES